MGTATPIAHAALQATVAAFDLTRSRMLTSDPLDPTRHVLTGRQGSRGIEVDIVGSLTPAWKLVAACT